MASPANELAKVLPDADRTRVEQLIAQLERDYPVEVVVALTRAPAVVPIAVARFAALVAVKVEILAGLFWWPIPAWALGLLVFSTLFLPADAWQAMAPFRWFAFGGEKRAAVRALAEHCFDDLALARTHARNALLVFFNVRERVFVVRPDRRLAEEWPQLKVEEVVAALQSSLAKDSNLGKATEIVLQRLGEAARQRWPEPSAPKKDNVLPDAVVWWMPS